VSPKGDRGQRGASSSKAAEKKLGRFLEESEESDLLSALNKLRIILLICTSDFKQLKNSGKFHFDSVVVVRLFYSKI
jgi:hypothetical protein